jgi:hypothetical protein
MLIEKDIEFFRSQMCEACRSPTGTAIYLTIPSAVLRQSQLSIQEQDGIILLGKNMVQNLGDGWFVRLMWSTYFGIINAKSGEVKTRIARENSQQSLPWRYAIRQLGEISLNVAYEESVNEVK